MSTMKTSKNIIAKAKYMYDSGNRGLVLGLAATWAAPAMKYVIVVAVSLMYLVTDGFHPERQKLTNVMAVKNNAIATIIK